MTLNTQRIGLIGVVFNEISDLRVDQSGRKVSLLP